MSKNPDHWVVDASVAIKLFIREIYSPETLTFFERLTGENRSLFYVPDLFYAECANIFWKKVNHHGYPAIDAKKGIETIKHIQLISVSSSDLMEQALEFAVRWDITAYDACYLALAERLKVSLVTADEKLLKRAKGTHLRVERIGNFKE
ncbi:MAG TPA: type II toxin-antitoxin system VapC family toxin [bacterium]|nr:type II toxin-antitoxin system VapC family toxin [bacterium]